MANLTVEIDLTDTEENNMKSHLVDIDAWVLALTTEKVNNCWKRMQKKWTDQLTNDKDFTDTIPSNKADFLKLVTARIFMKKIGHGKSFMLIGWKFYWLMKVLQMVYHLIKKILLI